MADEWAAVDALIRDLGSVRNAAAALIADDVARAAMERAIESAASAVNATIDAPRSHDRLTEARAAVGVAVEVISALDREIGRSLAIRSRAQDLSDRAAALIRQATQERRIRFAMTKRPRDFERIANTLGPLVEAGFELTVQMPDPASSELGWMVRADRAGRSLRFRLRLDAPTGEWDQVVRNVL